MCVIVSIPPSESTNYMHQHVSEIASIPPSESANYRSNLCFLLNCLLLFQKRCYLVTTRCRILKQMIALSRFIRRCRAFRISGAKSLSWQIFFPNTSLLAFVQLQKTLQSTFACIDVESGSKIFPESRQHCQKTKYYCKWCNSLLLTPKLMSPQRKKL